VGARRQGEAPQSASCSKQSDIKTKYVHFLRSGRRGQSGTWCAIWQGWRVRGRQRLDGGVEGRVALAQPALALFPFPLGEVPSFVHLPPPKKDPLSLDQKARRSQETRTEIRTKAVTVARRMRVNTGLEFPNAPKYRRGRKRADEQVHEKGWIEGMPMYNE
jgi:hypothetical protein